MFTALVTVWSAAFAVVLSAVLVIEWDLVPIARDAVGAFLLSAIIVVGLERAADAVARAR